MSPLSASFITYTDRAQFEAAVSSFTIDPMNYSSGSADCDLGAIAGGNMSHFAATTTPDAFKIVNTPCAGGFDTTGDSQARYLYLDTDIGFQGSQTTFSMHSPTLAFGFDYMGVNESGTLWQVTILGTIFNLPANAGNQDAKFWGAVSTTPFSTIVLYTDRDSGYGVDQVTFGTSAIPEPGSFAFLGLGLGALRLLKRRLGR